MAAIPINPLLAAICSAKVPQSYAVHDIFAFLVYV